MRTGLQRMKGKTKDSLVGYLLVTPFVLGFSIFTILPMLSTVLMSLTDWDLFNSPKFIGLENYADLFFKNEYFWKSLKATFLYASGGVILPQVAALLMAILLNQKIRCRPFFRTVFYLPAVLPAVSTIVLWQWMFNADMGPLNQILRAFGLPASQWIYSEAAVMPSLWLMAIWGCGSTMVVYLAALQDVPKSLLEAAEIDGAAALQKFRYITVPSISPVIFFNFLMGVIGALQVFAPAQLMTGGGPNGSTLFAGYYIYRLTFTEYRMGYACALAFIVFLIIMVLAILIFKLSSRWVFYNEEKN